MRRRAADPEAPSAPAARDAAKEGFDPRWLALREGVDHRSRSVAPLGALRDTWRRRRWSRVLDLGSGTGSNFRWLAPRLPGEQAWILLDDDPRLLGRAAGPEPSPPFERLEGDLAVEGLEAVGRADLVTASALLDLVSERWLVRLVEACRTGSCGALFALTWDGDVRWSRRFGTGRAGSRDSALEADDRRIVELLGAHQRRDKGVGPALGPEAGAVAERLFRDAGYRTWLVPSPWRLTGEDATLASALIDGWEAAAVQEGPEETERVRRWARRRREGVARGTFALTVGHVDLLALPAPGRAGGA